MARANGQSQHRVGSHSSPTLRALANDRPTPRRSILVTGCRPGERCSASNEPGCAPDARWRVYGEPNLSVWPRTWICRLVGWPVMAGES
ncbi:unnamed protein product [Protopolystoma xenopodis]|uniref:Uncharacterized protein n=1 Tax=Protopolystoma xenopodis TaxID=117903 RepID=A0A3S5AGD9_9PLAT|nr:unnamed protein product [Protopolystoma xenopodis]